MCGELCECTKASVFFHVCFVLSIGRVQMPAQVEDSFEDLSTELRRRIAPVLPAVTLDDTFIGAQHAAWSKATSPGGDGAQQRTVILLTVSKGFVDFLLNWRAAATRINVTRFLVIAEDEGSFTDLKQYDGFKNNVILSPTPIVTSESGFAYNSPSYNTMVGNRPRYIRTLLRMGVNVLYADVDSVWCLRVPDVYLLGSRILASLPQAATSRIASILSSP